MYGCLVWFGLVFVIHYTVQYTSVANAKCKMQRGYLLFRDGFVGGVLRDEDRLRPEDDLPPVLLPLPRPLPIPLPLPDHWFATRLSSPSPPPPLEGLCF